MTQWPEQYLVEDTISTKNGEVHQQCSPLKYFDLLNDFTQLQVSTMEVKKFAKKYGMLGYPVTENVFSRESNQNQKGESLASWKDAVKQIRGFIQLIDIEDGRSTTWPEIYSSLNGFSLEKPLPPLKYLPQAEVSDLVHRGTYAIYSIVNDRMAHLTHLELRIDQDTGFKRFVVVPKSLLGAIWLAAAEYASGDRARTEKCAACGRTYSPRRVRIDGPSYCSDRCRMRAYRQRHSSR